ncbi:MAG TPA: MmgE/PrpD family protein [Pseudonocardiaceae bacterium]|nr:MmgE/PrpD family protein [Pseudonocardiaceae bacterium]
MRDLAQAAAATTWAEAPVDVRVRVVELVGDVLAVTAFGSARAELVELTNALATTTPVGAATVVGSARGWPAATAGFLNGCAVAADQLQDGHRLARGHPASHTVPAALAVAEEHGSTVGEFLSAVLAGYEVGTRLGQAMGGTPTGVHDIGTWGQVAASVATARLVAPGDADAMRRAIELSAAAVLLTDAGTVFTGWSGSHAFLGLSVQHGLTAGLAAAAGLRPAPGSLDRHFMAVAGRTPRAVEATAGRWEVLAGYVKAYPTCAHLHGVHEAVDALLAEGVDAKQVDAVDVAVFAGAAGFNGVADSELAARFSIPTTVAIAIWTGRLDESTLTAQQVADPAVRELAGRVRVVHDPELDAGYPHGRPARVTITLSDGTTRSATVGRPRWDADRWPAPAELAAKRDRLLTTRFGVGARPLITALSALDPEAPIRDVGALFRAAAD